MRARDRGRLPNGRAWRERIDQLPEETRHLAVHFGHCVELNAHDARFVDMAGKRLSFMGMETELRDRLAELAGSVDDLCLTLPNGLGREATAEYQHAIEWHRLRP
jgi:hypothetical protein